MGLRYGLLAALTLVLASALLWDRLHPPRTTALFPRDLPAAEETVRIVLGGKEPPPPVNAPPHHGGQDAAGPPSPSPAAEVVPPTPPEERVYTVTSGDTLGGIALSTMGTSRKAAALAAHNGMGVGDPLRIGTVLRIPSPDDPGVAAPPPDAGPAVRVVPPGASRPAPVPRDPSPVEAPRSHRVGKGETLYAIARRYYGNGSRWRTIAEANGLGEGDSLSVGATLRIP